MIEAGRNAVNSQRYTPESKDEAVREVLQRKSHDAGCSYKNQWCRLEQSGRCGWKYGL